MLNDEAELEALKKVDLPSLLREMERLTQRVGLVMKAIEADHERAVAAMSAAPQSGWSLLLKTMGDSVDKIYTEACLRKSVRMPFTVFPEVDEVHQSALGTSTYWSLGLVFGRSKMNLSSSFVASDIQDEIDSCDSSDIYRALAGVLSAVELPKCYEDLDSGDDAKGDAAKRAICEALEDFVSLALDYVQAEKVISGEALTIVPVQGSMMAPSNEPLLRSP